MPCRWCRELISWAGLCWVHDGTAAADCPPLPAGVVRLHRGAHPFAEPAGVWA